MRAFLRLAALWASIVALGLGAAAAGWVYARQFPSAHMDPAGPVGWPPIQCGKPCVIEESHGGIIFLFTAQAEVFKAERTPVIIDGPCISACTILADIDRATVCVTTNAVFGYHKSAFGTVFKEIVFEDPRLNAYIAAHGGEPDPDSGSLLMVGFPELVKFYRPCAGAI